MMIGERKNRVRLDRMSLTLEDVLRVARDG